MRMSVVLVSIQGRRKIRARGVLQGCRARGIRRIRRVVWGSLTRLSCHCCGVLVIGAVVDGVDAVQDGVDVHAVPGLALGVGVEAVGEVGGVVVGFGVNALFGVVAPAAGVGRVALGVVLRGFRAGNFGFVGDAAYVFGEATRSETTIGRVQWVQQVQR